MLTKFCLYNEMTILTVVITLLTTNQIALQTQNLLVSPPPIHVLPLNHMLNLSENLSQSLLATTIASMVMKMGFLKLRTHILTMLILMHLI